MPLANTKAKRLAKRYAKSYPQSHCVQLVAVLRTVLIRNYDAVKPEGFTKLPEISAICRVFPANLQ